MTRDDPMWWYIGSTIHSPLFREQSRIRKYAQLEKGTDAFFEPALRIWFAKKNFFSYFVTPIRIIDDSIQLRAQELALIKQFRPKLNHPHCNPILKRLRISLQQYVLPTSSTGLLGNKLLERYFEERIPVDRAGLAVLWSRPDELFNILYRLGSNSRDKFEISRLLRSNSATLPFLYLLFRYCQLIDEPHHTQAKKLLVQALKFKGGDQPPANIPMQFLSLSIDTTPIFRDWLREFLQQHSNLFPWFHVPTTQIVHIKNPTWKTKVFNFHRFLKQWDPEQPPPCQCGGQDFFPTLHKPFVKQDIFLQPCWTSSRTPFWLTSIWKIALGPPVDSGWNKANKHSTAGKKDGNYPMVSNTVGTWHCIKHGNPIFPESEHNQTLIQLDTGICIKKFG